MRNPRVFLLIAGAAVLSLSPLPERTTNEPAQPRCRLAHVQSRPGRHTVLSADPDQYVERREAHECGRTNYARMMAGRSQVSAPANTSRKSRRSSWTASCTCQRESSRGARAGNRKEIWVYELKQGQASFRGVSYWPGDRNNPPRIFFTTARKLAAINALTGEPSTGFGNNGEIDLKIPYDGAPAIYRTPF